MMPRPEMIPKVDHKMRDPAPQMNPAENDEWHGVWFPGFLNFLLFICLFIFINETIN